MNNDPFSTDDYTPEEYRTEYRPGDYVWLEDDGERGMVLNYAGNRCWNVRTPSRGDVVLHRDFFS